MEKIKPIKQLDKKGCTIACMAMVTDKSYFEIRAILHDEVDRLKKDSPIPDILMGLYCNEFKDALEKIFDIRCKYIKFLSLKKLKKHCVLYLVPLSGHYGGSHTIVFDAVKRRIIDPFSSIEKINLDEHNVSCCIELQ